MTNTDPVLAALIRATQPHLTDEEVQQLVTEHLARNVGSGLTPDQEQAINAAVGGSDALALNDDAGLAQRLGMPLSHGTHFTH